MNEEEAVAIRTIFDQYVNTDLGANGIAKYLENHGIHKIARQKRFMVQGTSTDRLRKMIICW